MPPKGNQGYNSEILIWSISLGTVERQPLNLFLQKWDWDPVFGSVENPKTTLFTLKQNKMFTHHKESHEHWNDCSVHRWSWGCRQIHVLWGKSKQKHFFKKCPSETVQKTWENPKTWKLQKKSAKTAGCMYCPPTGPHRFPGTLMVLNKEGAGGRVGRMLSNGMVRKQRSPGRWPTAGSKPQCSPGSPSEWGNKRKPTEMCQNEETQGKKNSF